MLVYDDGLFAYSNHNTDPAGSRLCNAFDLVRLHKFGDLDDEKSTKTKQECLPSYKAMLKWVAGDKKIRELDKEEFCDMIPSKTTTLSRSCHTSCHTKECGFRIRDMIKRRNIMSRSKDNWKAALIYNKNGIITQNIDNVLLILRNDPKLKDALTYDEFCERPWVKQPLPWGCHL